MANSLVKSDKGNAWVRRMRFVLGQVAAQTNSQNTTPNATGNGNNFNNVPAAM